MYLHLDVAAYLSNLFNFFAIQPLLPLLARILKEKRKQKSSRTPSHQGYNKIVWKAVLSFCRNFHSFRSVSSFLILPDRACFDN